MTGAGGSIGAELARQVHHLGPASLTLLDRDESSLHAVQLSIYGNGLLDTPERVARAWGELVGGYGRDAEELLGTTFDIAHDEMVLVKDIEMWSMCEHHLVPFFGVAHIGYIPAAEGNVTGLSKLARLVDVFARRPQVQERLTTQIADALIEVLDPRGVIVVIEAEHLCMTMRGVRKGGARTITSAVRGQPAVNQAGGRSGRPWRDSSCSPVHSARTPSYFSLTQ